MILAITSKEHLPAAIREFRPDAVVSAHSPGWPAEPIAGVRHLRLAFHDIEHHDWHKTPPAPEHVESFLAFLDRDPRRLLISCHMGLGRAPALAIIALMSAGLDPAGACEAVKTAVPHASPNRLLLAIGADVLKRRGFAVDDVLVARAVRRTFTQTRDDRGATGEAVVLGVCPQMTREARGEA